MHEEWLSPMNKLIWIEAFQNKRRKVTLRDERVFNVKYSTEQFFRNEPAQEYAYVSPVKGGAPRGWFRMVTVTDPDWVHEDSVSAKGGMYIQFLSEFLERGHDAVDVVAEWPALEGRLASSIRQGFTAAIMQKGETRRKLLAKTIDGKVYLLKESVVSEQPAAS